MSGTVESMESMESMESSGSGGRGAFGPIRPLGVSPSPDPKVIGSITLWEGDRWPPPDSGKSLGNVSNRSGFKLAENGTVFRYGVWGIPFFCDVVLGQFVNVPAIGTPSYTWSGALDATADKFDQPAHRKASQANPTKKQTDTEELQELVDLIAYRAGVQSEAMAQRDSILPYFRGVLAFTQSSHPATFYLCMAAIRVGGFQSMYFKSLFNRARPSQLCPALMPPIDPPGHASYPSGHATQSYMLVLCLEAIQARFRTDTGSGATPDHSALRRVAERVARNREVLGLHYPSDTNVGRYLAERSFKIFQQCQAFNDLSGIAAAEW